MKKSTRNKIQVEFGRYLSKIIRRLNKINSGNNHNSTEHATEPRYKKDTIIS